MPKYRKALSTMVALRHVGYSEEAYPEQVQVVYYAPHDTHD